MSISEPLPKIYVPAFEIAINGTPLSPAVARQITSISVTEYVAPSSYFSVSVNDPRLQLIDARTGLFTEGNRIDISLGYVDNLKKIFIGEIAALSVDFPASGAETVEVQGFDLLHKLTRGTAYRKFEGEAPDSGISDSDIVSQIAREMGLKPSVETTAPRARARVQSYQTDHQFLEEIAHDNGFYLWADGDTLYFQSQPRTRQPGTVQLEWHKTLVSFSPRLSTAGQVNSIQVRGWDLTQKESFSARAERSNAAQDTLSAGGRQQISRGSGGRSELMMCGATVASAQEAEKLAQSLLAQQQQNFITGYGASVGNADIRVGTILQLSGIDRFNGSYLVEQATHYLSGSGYQTSFQVSRQL